MPRSAAAVPVVSTDRLVLRGCSLDDYDRILELWGDPEVTRFIGGKPSTATECWIRLLGIAGHWALQGFGFWLVEERDTGRFVGQVGCANLMRGLGPSFDDSPEAGWVLTPWCHGKGYATEAVRAALDWTEHQQGIKRFVCMIDPDHKASLHVAAKCGFRPFREASYKDTPVILLERLG